MHIWMRILGTTLAAIAVLSLHGAAQAVRQDGLAAAGLTVSPAIFEVIAEPGTTAERTLIIQNTSDAPVPVRAAMDRLRPTEPEIDLSKSERFNAAHWISVDEPHHILEAGEQRELTAVISVPDQAEPGGHYATILLQPLTPEAGRHDSAARIAPQVGVLVFITVPGDADTDLAVQADVRRFQGAKDVSLNAVFANTGTVHALPTATATVRNIFGSTRAELPLKPRIVLPNTAKDFPAEWDGPSLFGIYSAEVVATYGSDQAEITSGKRYFVVVRWLPLILLAALLVPTAIFTRKTYHRWPAAIRAFRQTKHG